MLLKVRAGFAVVLLAGCTAGEAPPAPAVHFPQYHGEAPQADAASFVLGVLTLRDDCLLIETSSGEAHLVVWPENADMKMESGAPVIRYSPSPGSMEAMLLAEGVDAVTVAPGDRIGVAGAIVNAAEYNHAIAEPLPTGCGSRVLIAKSVLMPSR